jgi:hypothetical protein
MMDVKDITKAYDKRFKTFYNNGTKYIFEYEESDYEKKETKKIVKKNFLEAKSILRSWKNESDIPKYVDLILLSTTSVYNKNFKSTFQCIEFKFNENDISKIFAVRTVLVLSKSTGWTSHPEGREKGVLVYTWGLKAFCEALGLDKEKILANTCFSKKELIWP